eukprot:6465260-Amphidinium_carterae.1
MAVRPAAGPILRRGVCSLSSVEKIFPCPMVSAVLPRGRNLLRFIVDAVQQSVVSVIYKHLVHRPQTSEATTMEASTTSGSVTPAVTNTIAEFSKPMAKTTKSRA